MSYIILIAIVCLNNVCVDVQVYDMEIHNQLDTQYAMEQCQRDKQSLIEQGIEAYCLKVE